MCPANEGRDFLGDFGRLFRGFLMTLSVLVEKKVLLPLHKRENRQKKMKALSKLLQIDLFIYCHFDNTFILVL